MAAQHEHRRSDQAGAETEDFAVIRFRTRRELEKTGRLKIGNCILGTQPRRPKKRFQVELLRLHEYERIIRSRHGRFLPEGAGHEFLIAVAHSLQVHKSKSGDVLTHLRGWCGRWAPWFLHPDNAETLEKIAESVRHRVHDLRAQAVAKLLQVKFSERVRLKLRTIGACDVSPARRKEMMAAKKLESDRAYRRAQRLAEGRKDRDEWLAENSVSLEKPWIAAGVSRATWYRQKRETGPSRVEDIWICDTPVSTAAKTVVDMGATPAKASSHSSKKKNLPASRQPITPRAAKRCAAEGTTAVRSVGGDRYADAKLLYLRFLKPNHPALTGSATEVPQAA